MCDSLQAQLASLVEKSAAATKEPKLLEMFDAVKERNIFAER